MNDFIKKPNVVSTYTPEQLYEIDQCAQDPFYFIERFVKVQHPTKGSLPLKLYPFQKKLVNAFHTHTKVIALTARQLGKTTTASAYLLWLAMFREDTKILIAANKLKSALEVMTRVKYAYEECPDYIKAGCKKNNELSLFFDNGSVIEAVATTPDAARGKSLTLLYCLAPDSRVTIRNKKTGEIRQATLAELHRYFFYDLVISSLRLAVEYNGKNFHPDPRLTPEERMSWRQVYTGKSAEEVDNDDKLKAKALLDKRGFDTLYVYEQSETEDVQGLLMEIMSRSRAKGREILPNTEWQILTPEGWNDFAGTAENGVQEIYRVELSNGKSVEATADHFLFDGETKIKVNDLRIGQTLCNMTITDIMSCGQSVVYDILDVDNKNHNFFVNDCFISKNCDEFAFVPPNMANEFYTAVQPTLSTGGKCIITSTPRTDSDQFAQIWKGAQPEMDEYGNPTDSEVGGNGFFAISVPWWEHPDRDEKWAKPFKADLGPARFAQEFECLTGNAILDTEHGQMTISEVYKLLEMGKLSN